MGINAGLRRDRGQYPKNGHKAAAPTGEISTMVLSPAA